MSLDEHQICHLEIQKSSSPGQCPTEFLQYIVWLRNHSRLFQSPCELKSFPCILSIKFSSFFIELILLHFAEVVELWIQIAEKL